MRTYKQTNKKTLTNVSCILIFYLSIIYLYLVCSFAKYYPITTVQDALLGVMNITNSMEILPSKYSYFNSYKSTFFLSSVFPSLYLIGPY